MKIRTWNETPRITKGFTLIELVMVIVIFAILAGVLLPAPAPAKSKARTVASLSNRLTSCCWQNPRPRRSSRYRLRPQWRSRHLVIEDGNAVVMTLEELDGRTLGAGGFPNNARWNGRFNSASR